MRGFIVLLLLANLGLFFWLQHDSLPDEPVAALPPPDVGRLQLLNEKPRPVITMPRETVVAKTAPASADESPSVTSEPVPPAPPLSTVEPSVAGPGLAEPVSALRPPEASVSIDATQDAPSNQPQQPPAIEPDAAEVGQVVDATLSVEADDPPSAASTATPEVVVTDQAHAQLPAGAATAHALAATVGRENDEPVTEPSCALIGPMSSQVADTLVGQLPAFVTLLSDMTIETGEADGYYVMIPALPSRSEGLAMLARLEAEGITDTWLFPRGVYRNAISLGLFSRRAGAERHLRNLVNLGFNAELIEKGSRKERRQLLVKNVDGGDVALSLPLPEGVLAEKRPCP